MLGGNEEYAVADTYGEAGIDISQARKSHGEITCICPRCAHTRKPEHQREKKLGVNLTKGKWRCSHCNWAGKLRDEGDRIAEQRRGEQAQRVYALPTLANHTGLSDQLVAWFEGRKISRTTLARFQIREAQEWMPQPYGRAFAKLLATGMPEDEARRAANQEARVNTVQFPFIEGGQCVNIKYRTGNKEFKLAKDAKLTLYNIDNALAALADPDYVRKFGNCLIMVEGEPDTMTWDEAGYRAVVSAPNGVALSPAERQHYERTGEFNDSNALNLEWLDNCWDKLQGVEWVYIAGDTDAPGMKLRRELIRRFGADRCKLVSYQGYKDANELAQKTSVLNLKQCYEAAQGVPIDGIHSVDSEWDDIMHLLENGLPQGAPIGIDEFDGYFSLLPGQLTGWTGTPGDGKTTVVYFLMMLTSLAYGWKWGVFSPENYPVAELFVYLAQLIVGKESRQHARTPEGRQEFLDALNLHIKDHFFLVNSDANNSHEKIRAAFRALVARYGITGALIDPYNDLPMPEGDGTAHVTNELSQYRLLNRQTGLTTWITAHPRTLRKVEGTNMYPVAQASDIFGGSAWWNRLDNLLCVHRERQHEDDLSTSIHVHKFKKHRQGGKPTRADSPIRITYEPGSGRFHGEGSLTTIEQFRGSLPAKQGFREPVQQREQPLRASTRNEFEDEVPTFDQPEYLGGGYSVNPDEDDDPPF